MSRMLIQLTLTGNPSNDLRIGVGPFTIRDMDGEHRFDYYETSGKFQEIELGGSKEIIHYATLTCRDEYNPDDPKDKYNFNLESLKTGQFTEFNLELYGDNDADDFLDVRSITNVEFICNNGDSYACTDDQLAKINDVLCVI